MQIFETHAHYDDEQYDDDREELIKSLKQSNIKKCITIGCDIKTSKKACDLSNKYDFIYTAIRDSSK